METIDCIQGTDEWFAAKLGIASASNFAKIKAKPRVAGKGGRVDYMYQLENERDEGKTEETINTTHMMRGVEIEPQAREYYEKFQGVTVEQVGFIKLDDNIGCSPDGLVGKDGLIEIKCPKGTTHKKYVVKDKLPTTYIPQVQGQLWVTNRKWCDFISYRPESNERPYWSIRVFRDEGYINQLAVEVNQFIIELEALTKKIINCPFE